jgi:hypothetical protein
MLVEVNPSVPLEGLAEELVAAEIQRYCGFMGRPA